MLGAQKPIAHVHSFSGLDVRRDGAVNQERRTMKLETQTHLTDLRKQLEWRIHELQTELHARTMKRDEAAQPAGVMDRKDEADAWQRSDIDAQGERLELEDLQRCQHALHRLDMGIYGDCCDCHEPIALERLQAQPEAERCTACQAAHEGHLHGRRPN
jgi:DnaK suppressor protein